MNARNKAIKKPIPHFALEDEERSFWSTHDTVEYFDYGKAVRATFPELKPSTATVSLRLPALMLEELKSLASARDVPYQSLLKVFLAERIAKERNIPRRVQS